MKIYDNNRGKQTGKQNHPRRQQMLRIYIISEYKKEIIHGFVYKPSLETVS